MEQKDIEGYLSLQELGAVIDKMSFQSVLPRKDRWITKEKDRLYQIHNPLKDEEDLLEEKATDNGLGNADDHKATAKHSSLESTSAPIAGQAKIAAAKEEKQILLIPINRKTAERIVLAFLICIISTTIILPFFLLIGDSIRPWSTSVSYDYDESCDNDTTVTDGHMYSDTCFAYEHGVCDPYLVAGGLTNITTLRSNMVSEQDVVDFFMVLDTYTSIVTKKCREATKPFICQYIFPPCNDDGSYQSITKDECLYIQHDVCTSEWLIALSIAPELVPNCEHLNDMLGGDSKQVGETQEQSNLDNSNLTNDTECAESFGLFCDNCLPLCSQFSQYDESTTTRRITINIFAAVLSIVGGILSIIFITIRRKKTLEFPAIYTLYMTFCPMCIAVLVLISHIDTEKDLYCPYKTLIKSYENPTAFCQVSGGAFQFCLTLMTMFWIFHLFHIFLKIVFPIKSRFLTSRKWSRGLHVSEVLISLFVSALGPAIVRLAGIQYGMAFFPPFLCLPTDSVFLFYVMCVPLMIVMTLGLNMIATMIWTLLKKDNILNEGSGRKKCSIGTPEVKIIVLLTYYIVFGLVISIYTGRTITEAHVQFDNLYAYLLCQLHGDNPACSKFQEEYYDSQSPHITSTVFLMMGLINWINLLFVVQYQDIKQIAIKISNIFHHYISPTTTYTTTNSNSTKESVTSNNAKLKYTETEV